MKRLYLLILILWLEGSFLLFAQSETTLLTTTEAASIASNLAQNEVSSRYYYVEGIVTTIQEVSTTYGNATFYFTDGTTELYCYRMFYLYNEKFTNSSQLQVGDTIRLYTRLKKYGTQNLLETTEGYMVYSSNLPNGFLFFTDGTLEYRRIHATDGLIAFCPDVIKQSLHEIVIPDSVQYEGKIFPVSKIGPYGFSSCSLLSSVTIPTTVTDIGVKAFYNCSSITSLTIPNSVTFIGSSAFRLCASLKSITIPENVTSIDQGATFQGCTSLQSVFWNARKCSISKGSEGRYYPPFYNLDNITSFVFGNQVQYLPVDLCYGCSGLTSVTIPNSVTTIGNSVFRYCSGLTTVTIPASVTNIGDGPFSSCTSLTKIIVNEANNQYCSEDGVLFSKDKTLLIQHPSGKKGEYTIPNEVTKINNYAFDDCQYIPKLIIPERLISIGSGAIKNCTQLDTVICYATTPPIIDATSFSQISSIAVLRVPYTSLGTYRANSNYTSAFATIVGFSNIDSITNSSAILKWLPDSTVVQYDINVYQGETHFAQYLVDGNGHIVSTQSFAPSVYHHKLDTTTSSTEYFTISLDGLSSGTDYTYTIEGSNAQSTPVYHEEGSFTTLNEEDEGLFDAFVDDPRKQVQKIIRDGQLYIIKGNKVYSLNGSKAID